MSDSKPNMPKGHSEPTQVTHEMMTNDAKAQATRGSGFLGSATKTHKQLQEINQLPRTATGKVPKARN